ncbi:MAG: HRDC domain-containing protein, partial [Thiohalocapsa sp.]
MRALGAKPHSFAAEIQGDYPKHSYPTAETLTLKQGAQVMFVRNDSASDKRYFNGKIGTVTHLERERIVVRCPANETEPETTIEVEPATWENIRYSLDKETKAISEEVIGEFIQYPLRLAWAITIHKSQGLTFERAIIDAAAAFSHGQVYVALSRCKTFEGMVLSAPIPRRAVMTDRQVSHYVTEAIRHPPTRDQLNHARIAYQQRLLQECWDFDDLGACLGRLLAAVRDNQRVIDVRGAAAMDALERQTIDEFVTVGNKFRRQLASLYRQDRAPEDDAHLQERLRKASAYFTGKLQQGLLPWLDAFAFETDNKAVRKTLRQAVNELRKSLAINTACIESCRERFSTTAYLGAVAKARIRAESRAPLSETRLDPSFPGDADDPELLIALRHWRARKAEEEDRHGVTHYRILTRAVLRQIADRLPDGPESLAAVKGIGKRTVERYGEEILGIVSDYCTRNGIDTAAVPRPGRQREAKAVAQDTDTRLISYRLY